MSTSPPSPPASGRLRRLGSRWLSVTAGLLLVGLLTTFAAYVQVPEGHAAVVTRFGRPVRQLTQAGPYWKWPWPIEGARLIDVRQRVFNTPYTATLTRDRRNVVLLTYVVWSVEDPLLFLQSVGDGSLASTKLDGMVTAAKNTLLGRYDLAALVSTEADSIRTPEIEAAIAEEIRTPALDKFGIAIDQVAIKRIAYEADNVTAVLSQMRAEREAEAKRLRALGDKEASQIRDDALVKSEDILRNGRLEAGRILGDAERDAARIYAKALSIDPEFYRYWRSLRTLEQTLGERTTVILRTDQGVFDLLTTPPELPDNLPEPPATSSETTAGETTESETGGAATDTSAGSSDDE